MNERSLCLQANQIEPLLDGDFTPAEASQLESHLGECGSCRESVEQYIGPSDWWSEVTRSLVAGDDEPFLPADTDSDEPSPMKRMLNLLGPSDDPAMLGRIGAYEITGLLGRGGMGAVFKGFDRSLNRFVAIKMLLPHLAESGAARKRFAREGQAVAAVVDDHVMAVHCVDEWQGIPFLVMTYSKGVSLQKRLSGEGPLELREILRIGLQAAKGLAAAHAQGLVHRDIKPANIFLGEKVQRVQLMDFGLARAADDASLTRTGVLAGTPQYMSPEQVRAERIDWRSDLFSLGSVLYAMCTGRAPFRAESSYGVLRLITDRQPRPIRELNSDIPRWLCAIIGRLMEKQARDRFSSAEEVAGLLEACLAHVQQPDSAALPASLRTSLGSRVREKFSLRKLGLGAALLCLLLGGPVGLLWQASTPSDIAGVWHSERWGKVELTKIKPGKYDGRFAAMGNPTAEGGDLHLKWSRVERRFNGTWKLGKVGNGNVSLRLVGGEIRGAFTSTKPTMKERGIPGLADLTWTRSPSTDSGKQPVGGDTDSLEHVAQPEDEEDEEGVGGVPDVFAWNSDNYTPPDFESYFPDDAAGGLDLDRLWNASDRNARPAGEILSTVRNGLRRTTEHRTLILGWIGNKYIWNKSPQNAEAIAIMYHAADFRERALRWGTRHYAVYFGLSVVRPKPPAVLQALADLGMQVDDPNDLGRIAWGCSDQKTELLAYLQPHLASADPATQAKAEACQSIFSGQLKAFAWAKERSRKQAQEKFAHQLPQIKKALISGTSDERKKSLKMVLQERVSLIMDDSFIPAFTACATDGDPGVRKQVAILAGDRWVWSAQTQNEKAIALMMKLSFDEDRQVRYNAVYYGLSVVRKKSDAVINRMLEIARTDREPNLFGRIEWGLGDEGPRVEALLYQSMTRLEGKEQQKAVEVFRKFLGRDPTLDKAGDSGDSGDSSSSEE